VNICGKTESSSTKPRQKEKHILAVVAVTMAVVKVPQNCCAASNRAGFLKARRQLSALQLAVTALADNNSWATTNKNDGILMDL